jgi:hypothetical protein
MEWGFWNITHVAHPTHKLHAVLIWSKCVYNEGHFKFDAEEGLRHYLASHYRGVTEKLYVVLPVRALQAV